MKELGKLTISRPTSNLNQDGWVRVELKDFHFNVLFIIDVDLKGFAQAVTGLGSVKCEFTTYPKGE